MKITFGFLLLLAGGSMFAMAGVGVSAPEIGSGSAGSAVALLAGALLIVRGSRKK